MIARWKARQACHGGWWLCCQYVDDSLCNTINDPHIIGRLVSLWYNRKETKRWLNT